LRAHSFPVETVHLHVRSGFSYGLGVATPEELVAWAAELGMVTMALTDQDGLYGIPRFLAAAEEHGVTPIVGADITMEVAEVVGRVVLLAGSPAGYRSLCRLITDYSCAAEDRRHPGCSPGTLLEHSYIGSLRRIRRLLVFLGGEGLR
jgi:error-prone DNA polymerase